MAQPLSGELHPGANLARRDLTGADLRGADLTAADLRGACLRSAMLYDTVVSAELFQEPKADAPHLPAAILRRANLEGADLSSANLIGADFTGANLSHCRFEGALIRRTSFRDADLSGVNLIGHALIDVDLRNARLTGARLDPSVDPAARGANMDGYAAEVVLVCAICDKAFVHYGGIGGSFIPRQIAGRAAGGLKCSACSRFYCEQCVTRAVLSPQRSPRRVRKWRGFSRHGLVCECRRAHVDVDQSRTQLIRNGFEELVVVEKRSPYAQ